MTTIEHALVGMHGALLLGVNTKAGWAAITLAAVASILPDFDGLALLVSVEQFDAGHRVWGHNLLVIVITSLILAGSQYRFHWIERLARRSSRILLTEAQTRVNSPPVAASFLFLFVIVATCQIVHLFCDMVVSGGHGLSHWEVLPFWPFHNKGFVFPLIPWGDVGPTVILMLGAITLAKLPQLTKTISGVTLLTLCSYLAARGAMS
ncbi:hypothetical protein Pla110_45260 [Polystyrenella longa]|uniref:Inner membrane protein n=1 Tax=Polystyrenella longa TaxID=2528007 RepID=A0A518CU93_9PLAN|nr:metal-dependent hydrolase [Polystyrenella longa]QDU82764.1 hypothetical protein Pla110_45260 [Polystyrenella longa]